MNRIVPGWDNRVTCSDVAQPRMYLRVSLLEHLDLRDAVLVGHSMGTGEVTRYLASYGSGEHHALQLGHHRPRVAKGVLVSPIPPYLLQTPDNPDGVPQSLFDGFAQAARADTPAWMKGFLDNFYNVDTLRGTLVSDQAWQASWNLAVTASATAAVACIGTWTTDFRDDLPKIDVPMLVVHGDADQVLPIDKTGKRLPGLIKDMQPGRDRGRPARHPLDPRRPGQHRAAGLPAPLIPGRTTADTYHRRSHHVEPLQRRLSQVSRRRPAPGHHRRVLVQVIQGPGQAGADRQLEPDRPGPGTHPGPGPGVLPRRGLPDQHRHRRRRARRRRVHLHLLRLPGRQQTGTAWYATGAQARQPEPAGEVLAEAFPVSFDGTAPPLQAGPDPAARRAAQRPVLRRPRGHPAQLRRGPGTTTSPATT